MAGVEEIIISDHYMIVLGVTLLFSVFALVRRTVVLCLLSTVCWWICGGIHLLASPTTTPLYSVSFLWFGIGWIFFVLVWAGIIQNFRMKKQREWEEVEI